jgi:general secretion pathway protein M
MKQTQAWQTIQSQWIQLTKSEKHSVQVLILVLVIALIYWLIWSPINVQHQKAKQQLQNSENQWHWLVSQVPLVAGISKQSKKINLSDKNSLSRFIEAQLKRQNLYQKISGMQLHTSKVEVDFDNINAPRMFRWLGQMELEGLIATTAKITPLKNGIVKAKISFKVIK